MPKPPNVYEINVFINCPFDDNYKPLFHAIVFTVCDAGFEPRCSKEVESGTHDRLDNIMDIISQCKYGIHDISRTELDPKNPLPRFNMPLELGIFLGCEEFGRHTKVCLILDKKEYRYQKFISDIAGRNVRSHNNKPKDVIRRVRDWLVTESKWIIPGGAKIYERYSLFKKELPDLAGEVGHKISELTFLDLVNLVKIWIKRVDESTQQKFHI